MGMKLDGSRIVSHSTGHYLAMKMMNKKKVKEYWALSPNTRGSTMIHALRYLMQNYDSWEDMRRHNYDPTIETETKENECVKAIAELTPSQGSNPDSNILLSHGDAMTGGQGNLTDLAANMGVLSYSDFQKANYTLGDRRRLFLKYEALDNLKKYDLKNLGNYKITIWDARRSFYDLLFGIGGDALIGTITSKLALSGLTAAFGEGAAVVVLYKAYDTVDDLKDIVLALAEAGKYLSMDVMEHVDLGQRLVILGENYEYGSVNKTMLGAVYPARDVHAEYDTQAIFEKDGNWGAKIIFEKGARNIFTTTEKYEIIRRVKGDDYAWKVGEVEFSKETDTSNTVEYFDALEGKIKNVIKVTDRYFRAEVDEGDLFIAGLIRKIPPVFSSPFRYTDGILAGKELVITDGAAGNHFYKIIDNTSDLTNPSDPYTTKGTEILCQYDSGDIDQEIERIKQDNKFIIRGI